MHPPCIISRTLDVPEFGERIKTDVDTSWKRRVVVGWNHQDDTPEGRKHGKIWAWRSAHDCFQVYDQKFNRSETPGDVRFCGVANFTMVRMFHPVWCPDGQIPQDMVSEDKKRCRRLYTQLYDDYKRQHNLGDDEPTEVDSDNSGNNETNDSSEDTGSNSDDSDSDDESSDDDSHGSSGDNIGSPSMSPCNQPKRRRRPNRMIRPASVAADDEVIGNAEDDPMFISDDEGYYASGSDEDVKEDFEQYNARESSVSVMLRDFNRHDWRTTTSRDRATNSETQAVKDEVKNEDEDDKSKVKIEISGEKKWNTKQKRIKIEIDLTMSEPEVREHVIAEKKPSKAPEIIVIDDSEAEDDRRADKSQLHVDEPHPMVDAPPPQKDGLQSMQRIRSEPQPMEGEPELIYFEPRLMNAELNSVQDEPQPVEDGPQRMDIELQPANDIQPTNESSQIDEQHHDVA